MTDERVGSLEGEALKRKERLAALKKKSEESKEHQVDGTNKLPKPKFRSYKPQDDSLKEQVVEDAKPGDVIAEVQDQLSAATSKVVVEDLIIPLMIGCFGICSFPTASIAYIPYIPLIYVEPNIAEGAFDLDAYTPSAFVSVAHVVQLGAVCAYETMYDVASDVITAVIFCSQTPYPTGYNGKGDISNLAPRKPDWDLKRDVAAKLEKLERRTQKAIAELIMERLKHGQNDLASVVNMVSEK